MAIRILCFILAAIFAASGIAKLASLPFEVEAFARWGYPPAFMYFTGALEVAGAVGLLVPRLSAAASLCLSGLMIGATATHAAHSEWPMLVVASIIMAAAAWRAWRGHAEIRSLGSGLLQAMSRSEG